MRRLLSVVAVASVGAALAVLPTVSAFADSLQPVIGLHATGGAAKVTLTWTNPSPAPTSIVVREAPGTAAPQAPNQGVNVATSSATSAVATGLAYGKKYSFAVFAVTGSAAARAAITSSALGATTMSIGVSPLSETYGAKAVVSGHLRLASGGAGVAGQKVTLYQRQAGTTAWVGWMATTTNSAGSVAFKVSFGRNTQFEIRHTANSYYGAATSKVAKLTMAAKVTLSGPTVVKTYDTVALTGRVSPGAAREVVYLQRYTTHWATVKSTRSSSSGSFAFAVIPTGPLVYQLRAYVPATSKLASGHSPKVTIDVAARDLTDGESGPDVLILQQRLAALHYDVGAVNGSYGYDTFHAVTAFEKVQGLPRDGAVGLAVRKALAKPIVPTLRFHDAGRSFEVDKSHQIVIMSYNGVIQRIIDSSTGFGGTYYYAGVAYQAITPEGTYYIQRKINGVRVSNLGSLYRPAYFFEGYAIHGEGAVPAYPASHGCVRITIPAMDRLYDLLTIGTPVHIYH